MSETFEPSSQNINSITYKEAKIDEPFTQFLASRIVYTSFAISQKETILHNEIFKYIHAARPTWTISNDMAAEIFEKTKIGIEKTVHPSRHNLKKRIHKDVNLSDYEVEKETKNRIFEMQSILNTGDLSLYSDANLKIEEETKEQLIPSITQRLIQCDHKYRNGRKRSNVDGRMPYKWIQDPNFSFVAYFVLGRNEKDERNSIDIPVLDEMFEDIETYLRSLSMNDVNDDDSLRIAEMLPEIIDIFNSNHNQHMQVAIPSNIQNIANTMKSQNIHSRE